MKWRWDVRYLFFLWAGILAIALFFFISPKRTQGDFDVYYKASKRYVAHAPVYEAHGGIEEYKYAPLIALIFAPLTGLPKITALYCWNILNIFALYFIFYILYKLKQITFISFKDFLIVNGLLALTGCFIFAHIRLGQINIILCALMVLTMYLEMRQKYLCAGMILAFSLMIKFFPLLFLGYYLLKKRWVLVGTTLGMVLVFLSVPSLYSGFSINGQYLHDWWLLLKSSPSILFYSPKNNSLLALYAWIFIAKREIVHIFDYLLITKSLTPAVYGAWGISAIVLLGSFFHDVFQKKNTSSDVQTQITYLDYSCLFVCGLLLNPLAYPNAFVFLIVPYFFILRHLFYGAIDSVYFKWMIGLLVLVFALTILSNKMSFMSAHQFFTLLEYKPLTGVLVLSYVNLWIAKHSLKRLKKGVC